MSEQLKVGDRVDVPKDGLTGNEKDAGQWCEDWGVITDVYTLARVETPNGAVERLLVERLRKHKPKPKPGDYVVYVNAKDNTDKRFIAECISSCGKAYWVYERIGLTTDGNRVDIGPAEIMELASNGQVSE